MNCETDNLKVLPLTAGQKGAVPLTFLQPSGAPLDLTGATVHLIAKAALTDDDDAAVLDIEQAVHTDAAAGETSLPIDLSALPVSYAEAGGRLTASLWLVDAAGDRIPYGMITVDIQPSARKSWS